MCCLEMEYSRMDIKTTNKQEKDFQALIKWSDVISQLKY